MSWFVLAGIVLALAFATLIALQRRADVRAMEATVERREEAHEVGAAKAELRHPVVDLSRCLGCATCVAACPEDGVLELVHGQAAVVRGARCIGAAACERECPVDAITVTLTDVEERRDIPALTSELEAIGTPGLFLAGEVTAHALIKTALDHGAAVAGEVADRIEHTATALDEEEAYDLCIVGAGPAGLSCSLEAKRRGLSFITIDQEGQPGGTVARYPRRKLVSTQPIEIPMYGKFRQTSFTKEELIELWQGIVEEQELPIAGGQTFEGLTQLDGGGFIVRTQDSEIAARNVCLALGRRGAPRKLEVPGETLPKVAYSLLDARSYTGRRVMVVGGGDSAVEAAVALAEQAGTEVTISYRRSQFFRIKSVNERRLNDAVDAGSVKVLYETNVRAIYAEAIELEMPDGRIESVPNDEVFIMAGGIAPVEVLERSGVSFDPSVRQKIKAVEEQGTGLVRALAIALATTVVVFLFALWNLDYYALEREFRPEHPKHDMLRPGRNVGLWLGILSVVLVVVNLLYLVRRSPRFVARFAAYPIGSLRVWMTSHVATGVLAFLLALLHAAMAPRDTVGSHALWALLALLVTGAIGRYLYAWVPRATNGRELEVDEVKAKLATLSGEWDGQHHEFGAEARAKVTELVHHLQWKSTAFGRISSVVLGNRQLNETMAALRESGEERGLAEDQINGVLGLTKRAYSTALGAAHLEDIRALLGSWRYIHRWVAALMVILMLFHIGQMLFYGQMFEEERIEAPIELRASIPAGGGSR
ncbi:MAG: NAD(P)-binding domain-containing protein [Planctomycetota bacterium]